MLNEVRTVSPKCGDVNRRWKFTTGAYRGARQD